jgi:SAM-dependent methyltransferase
MNDGWPGTEIFYGSLASWWPLISPVGDYAEEAAYIAGLLAAHHRPLRTLLELGSGGGHIAHHLAFHLPEVEFVLTDLSDDMLAVSRTLNPGCRHLQGDMRTLRLRERFDAVLIHDAVEYMLTEADLRAAITTAATHLEPGGVVVIAPDATAESVTFDADVGGVDATDPLDGRGVRFLEWTWDPDPNDTWIQTEYSFILRERDGTITTTHESHRTGVFPEQTWQRLLADAGLAPSAVLEETTEDRPPRTLFLGVSPNERSSS